jgi:molybdenum cofactor guanylyltransferase
MKATGIILAGGRSSRMGSNKALLSLEGATVIERVRDELKKVVQDIIIVTSSPDYYLFLGCRLTGDIYQNGGPLAGLHAGLKNSHTDYNLVAACDMPFLSAGLGGILLKELSNCQAAVPEISGQLHPLFGAYHRDLYLRAEEMLEAGDRKMRNLLNNDSRILKEKDLLKKGWTGTEASLFNMNHPFEYEQAKRMLGRET